MKITLQDIIDQVAEQAGTTKKLSEDFLREFLNIIEEALDKDGVVKIKGLGTFKRLLVEERKSVNVQTGEEIVIPSHNKISFIPEKELKTAINKPYSHLETYILSKDGDAPVDIQENEDEDDDEENEIPVIVDKEEDQPEIIIPVQENEESVIVEEESQLGVIPIQKDDENEIPVIIDEEETQSEIIIPIQEDDENEIPVIIEENQSEIAIPIQGDEENENNMEIDSTEEESEEEEKKKKKGCGWWILILLILLGLAAFLLWYFGIVKLSEVSSFIKEKIKTEQVQITPEDEISEDDEMTSDEQAQRKKIMGEIEDDNVYIPGYNEYDEYGGYEENDGFVDDSTTPNPNRNPEFKGEYMFDKKFDYRLLDFMQANYPNMKLITYGTPKEVELKEGSRLTLMSLEHYGSKRFWVYIYLYNTDIIQNPNLIPAGTMIKIPRLDNSLVNPNNPANIKAAWDVQKYLLKM